MRTIAGNAKNDAVRAQTAGAPWQGIAAAAARRFHQVCAARVATVVGEHGLTPLQYAALLHLSWNAEDAGLEQNVLATRLNIDRNTASVVVEQLVKLGLTARRVNGARSEERRV